MTHLNIIYTNGILTNPQEAAETAALIHQQTGIDTEVLYNGSTPIEVAGEIGKSIASGLFHLAGYFWNPDNVKLREQGLYSIRHAVEVWQEIQTQKETCAKALAGRVQELLSNNPDQEVLLILHSQGTHVGLQALQSLQAYQGRIHVIGIGGMVRIPESLASTVVNFAHSDDPVPNYVAPVVGPHNDVVLLGEGGHDSSAYILNEKVHQAITTVC